MVDPASPILLGLMSWRKYVLLIVFYLLLCLPLFGMQLKGGSIVRCLKIITTQYFLQGYGSVILNCIQKLSGKQLIYVFDLYMFQEFHIILCLFHLRKRV